MLSAPFGGVGVWVVGDFGQLVKATSLLVGGNIVEAAETGRRSKAMCGCRLFQEFETVVRLRNIGIWFVLVSTSKLIVDLKLNC